MLALRFYLADVVAGSAKGAAEAAAGVTNQLELVTRLYDAAGGNFAFVSFN